MLAGRETDAAVAEAMGWHRHEPISKERDIIVGGQRYHYTMGCARCDAAFNRSPAHIRLDCCEGVPKPYSTDISAAWEVIQWHIAHPKRNNGRPYAGVELAPDNGEWIALFDHEWVHDGGKRGWFACADTAPLAICRAFLAAVAPIPQAIWQRGLIHDSGWTEFGSAGKVADDNA